MEKQNTRLNSGKADKVFYNNYHKKEREEERKREKRRKIDKCKIVLVGNEFI